MALCAAASVAAGCVIAQAVGTDGLDALVDRALARADAMRSTLDGHASQGQNPTRRYGAAAASLADANRQRLGQGLTYLAPRYRAGPLAVVPEAEAGTIYVAISLSMPRPVLRQLAGDAEKAGAVLVLRGLVDGSFAKTQAALRSVYAGDAPGGLVIDPRVFEQYDIRRVPAFIAAPEPVAPCESGLDCVRPATPFDIVRGNISLGAALRLIATKGASAPGVASRALARMGG